MRHALALVVLAALTGCASTEYSKVPEPTGEWVPANPASLMVQATPPRPQVRRVVWRRRTRVVPPAPAPAVPVAPTAPAAPASDKVASQ